MRIRLNKRFKKQFARLKPKEQKQCRQRLKEFMDDPFNKRLNNHALQGKYKGTRSINITGNLRAIYELENKEIAYFIDVDNHGNLYS